MFRSPRLEALFGKRLNEVTFADVEGLKGREEAAEAADLDYKELVHAKNPEQKAEFCKDVLAMANDRGGALIVGIREDGNHAIPEEITKVDIGDGERQRLYAVLTNTSPHPLPVEIVPVKDPGDPDRGVLLVLVERSPLAPHAVLDTQPKTHHRDGWLRYPIRNGAATRWMLEPEVATRYRRRFAEARDLSQRLDHVEAEAITAYTDHYPASRSGYALHSTRQALPIMSVALAPEIPGNLRINRAVHHDFQQQTSAETLIDGSPVFSRRELASRKLIGTKSNGDEIFHYGQLHADGAGVLVFNIQPKSRFRDPEDGVHIPQQLIVFWVLSSLLILGRHARNRVGASGAVSARFRLLADAGLAHPEVGDSEPDEVRALYTREGGWTADRQVVEALGEADAFVDDVADEGRNLVSLASMLADEAFQAFGIPEISLFTPDGIIIPEAWGTEWQGQITTWAQRADALPEQ